MTTHVNIGVAETCLSELVAASLRGEEVVLHQAGLPVAQIVAVVDAPHAAGRVRVAPFRKWIGSVEGQFPLGVGDVFNQPDRDPSDRI